ncbi:cell division protein FtsQ [Aureimonas sp. SA4125]|uniref:cell division protein FtsQ/DivIB n=1 Tax=Aureimonas sp. SA4125 TaxID=2826993 RepID=UPI001CC7EB70|nr:cell division protein FtsQ/DivIB [Aureimonas sp. SA4125]BDA85582.1 cell division protein FtsQ [Aureimonas sp. SA4125]
MRSLNAERRPVAVPSSRLGFRLSVAGRRLAALGERLSHFPAPRFGVIATVLLTSTGLYGMSLGQHTTTVIDAVSQPLGFSIDKIDVSGNSETSEIDVLQALWQTGAQSLPSLDPDAARQTLEGMPWIEKASVAKTYPDRVAITLTERKPFALWQKGRELFVVDRDGREIVPYVVGRFSGLPFVVGTGAALHGAEFVEAMEVLPELRARVKAYIRVGDRRWDLRLENGMTVRLPEEGAIEAAADVSRMDRELGLLSRDILVVDMRIEDRVVVRLTPDALVRRDAAMKERMKNIKRSQKAKPV